MTQSATLPAPYRGVNESVPLAALESPFCENLVNFNVTRAGISLRHGDSKVQYVNRGVDADYATGLAVYADKLFSIAIDLSGISETRIYNALTNTLVYTGAPATGLSQTCYVTFNRYLFIFGDAFSDSVVYNGTAGTWAAVTFTGISGQIASACVYNNRMYMSRGSDGTTPNRQIYWYTELLAITGAVNQVDLSGVFNFASDLSFVAPLTIADNVSAVTMLCCVAMSGEILFYSGSYPDSASWSLIGRAQIGELISYNAYVAYQGDILAFSKNGVVSLRDLFLKGSEQAANLTVNTNVQDTWRATINGAVFTSEIRGCWDSVRNKIIIQFPYASFDPTSGYGGCYFVFDTIQQAWSFHKRGQTGVQMIDIAFCDGVTYTLANNFGNFMVYEKEGATGFTDRTATDAGETAYDYEMLSAPIPFPKTAAYETTQIEPILESDLYSQTNWNLVADFGRQTSNDQKTDALTTSVAKPAVNVGMQNITYVQVKMSGTTTSGKTVGLDLYSYNVWYNSGEIASR